jgi:apolipoprotein N-acyltransferase
VSPFGDGLAAGERPYRTGEPRRPLRAGVGPLGVLICSEGLFPDAARELANAGAVLLVHPSNDFWMGSPAAAEIMLRSAAFRAIETRRPLVRATPTGFSAFVDDRGRVIERAPWGAAQVIFGEMTPSSVTTPYVRLGDLPLGLAAAAALGLALAPARHPPARGPGRR